MGPACVAVGYSGGRDSSALLHATLAAAAPLGVRVAALHVHHGLSLNGDTWLAHCEGQCRHWARRDGTGSALTFDSYRASGQPAAGESIEAWARTVRYRALREMALAHGATLVLLAHHRRDQAETFLLQALRGAGPAGLAGMPESALRDGVTWARPWLQRPRSEIDAYVARHRIRCVEDDSNDDLRYARNRLRLGVWPTLIGAFPHAESALADSAQWAQEALSCLADLARQDMAPLTTGGEGLDLKAWLALSPARRSNVLRVWLKLRTGCSVPASLVARLMIELQPIGPGRWPVPGGELRAYRGVLRLADHDGGLPATMDALVREAALSVKGAGEFRLPGWGGCLQVSPVREFGVPLAWLGRLELKSRSGAERFQAGLGRPPRSLKKQYQDKAVPEWERVGPLVFSGGQLVFVPGLGLDARVLALPGQEQVSLRWVPLTSQPRASPSPAKAGG